MADPERSKKKFWILIFVLGIVGGVIALIVSSIKKLETDEVGVAYDVHQKTLADDVQSSGLHTGTPGFEFVKFPSVFKTLMFDKINCVNKEGLEIKIKEQFQYRARPKRLRQIIVKYKDHKTYVEILKVMAVAAIHDACSAFNASDFQTRRALFQEQVLTMTAQRFNNVSADLTDLQISNIQRPASYETAIRNKETAKENIKLAETQRPRLLIAADTRKQEALSAGDIITQKAASDSSIILAKADAQASEIVAAFDSEATAYETIMQGQNLTVDGLLSYLAVRVVAETKSVNVAIKGPAKTKYTYT